MSRSIAPTDLQTAYEQLQQQPPAISTIVVASYTAVAGQLAIVDATDDRRYLIMHNSEYLKLRELVRQTQVSQAFTKNLYKPSPLAHVPIIHDEILAWNLIIHGRPSADLPPRRQQP